MTRKASGGGQLALLVEERPAPVLAVDKPKVVSMTDKEVKDEVERDYLAVGWAMVKDEFGWMRLVHVDGRETGESATYRGLLRHLRRMGV